ncbi:MAG: MATE family efflux transporter [Epulopiscium sp.]|nr:MATE family efflux transporter [Candidatus Epulonipiscium sp.]
MEKIKKMLKDKQFFAALLGIALPITLQNLIGSSLNMVDTLMISNLGDASVAAVGLANQIYFFYMITVLGVQSGSSIFIAQFWGKKDTENIQKVLGLALTISSILGVIFTTSTLLMPEYLMKFFTHDTQVIQLGSLYLRGVSLTYIMTAFSFAFGVASRSIGQAKMPMRASLISFFINIIFNYLLIFGKFGFPALGVLGAAYGTLIARMVELAIIIYAIYKHHNILAIKPKEVINWNGDFVKKYLKTTYPVIINEAFWSLGMVMYSVAYAKISTEAVAAIQIATNVQNIFLVLSRGLANACTVMIGNKIGAKEEEEAITYANRFLWISVIQGLLLGIILYFSASSIVKIFNNITPEVYTIAVQMLKIMAFVFFIKMFNGNLIVGVLRGGGDTTFSMWLDVGAVWFVGVPLAFLGAVVFKLPVHWVTALVSLEEIVKALAGIPRLLSNKWIINITEKM